MTVTSKQEVLIAGSVRFAQDDLVKMGERYTVHFLKCSSRAEFIELCKTKYQNIKALYRHPDSARAIGEFDAELLNNLPKRYIQCLRRTREIRVILPTVTLQSQVHL